MKTAIVVIAAAVLLGGCWETAPDSSKRDANPQRYGRDQDLCRAQVREMMRTDRNIDDSRRDVFAGNSERDGRSALPDTMAALGDQNRESRLMSSCLEARGWPQPQKQWWQKIGS